MGEEEKKQEGNVVKAYLKKRTKDGKDIYEMFPEAMQRLMLGVRTVMDKNSNGECVLEGNGKDTTLACNVAVSKNTSEFADIKSTELSAEEWIPPREKDNKDFKPVRRPVIKITLKKKS